MVSLGGDFYAAMHILGSAVRGAQMKFGRGAGVSPASVVTHIDRMGVRAVPIIVLMSFLIGAIIAQQGAFQLRYFGAEIFVVDLVGILQLRETRRAADGDHDRRSVGQPPSPPKSVR
jgi:phospholipid/cholesterol/gamma-HCH transport system permease protein